jgi:mono/diheme cytochrome c family protein
MFDGPSLSANPMRWMTISFVAVAAIFALPFAAHAQLLDGNPASGRKIATTQCGSCHRVLPFQYVPVDKDSPPSFQSIADLPSTTGISLNVFLHSNHKKMPDLILSKPDANDVIAYVLSLKK